MATSHRKRATAVLVRDGKVLLVRNKGDRSFSLPGGGMLSGESSAAALMRELFEETGLHPSTTEFLFVHRGKSNEHSVFRVEADGAPLVDGTEVEELLWWDGKSGISANLHVIEILERCGFLPPGSDALNQAPSAP